MEHRTSLALGPFLHTDTEGGEVCVCVCVCSVCVSARGGGGGHCVNAEADGYTHED